MIWVMDDRTVYQNITGVDGRESVVKTACLKFTKIGAGLCFPVRLVRILKQQLKFFAAVEQGSDLPAVFWKNHGGKVAVLQDDCMLALPFCKKYHCIYTLSLSKGMQKIQMDYTAKMVWILLKDFVQSFFSRCSISKPNMAKCHHIKAMDTVLFA